MDAKAQFQADLKWVVGELSKDDSDDNMEKLALELAERTMLIQAEESRINAVAAHRLADMMKYKEAAA